MTEGLRARLATTVAVLLVLLTAATARAVEPRGRLRLVVGPGVDSNPRRDFTSSGISTVPDMFLAGFVQAQGALLFDRVHVSGNYDISGRKFLITAPSEDTLVQNASLDVLWAAHRVLDVGAMLRGRDRRGATRDYTDLGADALLAFLPDEHLEVRAHAGGHRFLFWNRFATSFFGPAFGGSVRYRFDKRHSAWASGDYEPRTFNAIRVLPPGSPAEDPPVVRADNFFSVGAGYGYKGKFQASLSYLFTTAISNGYGESFQRHRISGNAAFQLPLDLTLLVNGALQIASYPDGIYLSSELIVLDDDENASNVTVKLVYPLGEHVELDVRGSGYFSRLSRNELTYLRLTGMLGVSVHW